MDFKNADSVGEALATLSERGDEVQVLAGGTDVMIQYSRREISPAALLHIGRIPGLNAIESNGTVSIGPLVSHRTLATDRHVAAGLPALREAAATVGSWQTQEVGTVGGNICNASPAADTAPPLLIADTFVELTSTDGVRRIPLNEFFLGRRQTMRRHDELLTGITATPLPPASGEVYLKLGRRSAMEVAIVGIAVRLTFDSSDTVTKARVAVCSVAPRPYRAVDAEHILEGNPLTAELIDEAGQVLADSATPIDDARASARYRKTVLPRLFNRAIKECVRRAERSES